MRALADDMADDWRRDFHCWLSKDVRAQVPTLNIGRLLVFEPPERDQAPQLIGDIFRALMPALNDGGGPYTLAMPLLATGSQRRSVAEVVMALFDAAVHWLALGLPVARIMLVDHREQKAYEARGAFRVLKRQRDLAPPDPLPAATAYDYDLFISYSHRDTGAMMALHSALLTAQPDLRVFVDRTALNPGAAWQQALFEALDACQMVVALLSPDYLASTICKEEFNIALFRHREAAPPGVLVPLLLRDTELPTYMRLIQYIDCRGDDAPLFDVAAPRIVAALHTA